MILQTFTYNNPNYLLMTRAYSVTSILNTKFKEMQFEGEFLDLIGKPELSGCWFIQGGTGNGKTTFTMKLCRYLSNFATIGYNSLEEGVSQALKKQLRKHNMKELGSRFKVWHKIEIPDLIAKLKQPKSPQVIVIDTVQYAFASLREIKAMIDSFPNKLFIIISHEHGKTPEGTVAVRLKQLAGVKIRIIAFVAFCMSRYLENSAGKPYVIWEEEARKFHPFLEQTNTLNIL